jgi:hypothetical protein
MRLWYDGNEIDIAAEPCGHCKAVPTEQDARKAIVEYHRLGGALRCAVCGDSFKVGRMRLYHEPSCEATPWPIVAEAVEPHASGEVLLPDGIRGPVWYAHIHCISKALPHAGWSTMLFETGKETR